MDTIEQQILQHPQQGNLFLDIRVKRLGFKENIKSVFVGSSYFIQLQLLCPKHVIRTVGVSTSFSCTKRKDYPPSENIFAKSYEAMKRHSVIDLRHLCILAD